MVVYKDSRRFVTCVGYPRFCELYEASGATNSYLDRRGQPPFLGVSYLFAKINVYLQSSERHHPRTAHD